MRQDKKIIEPKLNKLISWLIDNELTEDIEELDSTGTDEKIKNLIYYFKDEQVESFYEKIKSIENSEDKKKIVENLINLYPLSKKIVEKILQEGELFKPEDLVSVYDAQSLLRKALNQVINMVKQNRTKIPQNIKDLEEKIINAEKTKAEVESKLQELKLAGSKEKELYREVQSLKKEVAELELSYTRASLEKQKVELEERKLELKRIKDSYEKDKAEVKNIENELRLVTTGNAEYKKSLRELSKIIKNI